MTHSINEKTWKTLELDEKLDALRDDIGKLFGIAEDLHHKQHVFVDAIQLVHGRLNDEAQAIRKLQSHAARPEMID